MCKILATENSISKEQLLVKGDVKRNENKTERNILKNNEKKKTLNCILSLLFPGSDLSLDFQKLEEF